MGRKDALPSSGPGRPLGALWSGRPCPSLSNASQPHPCFVPWNSSSHTVTKWTQGNKRPVQGPMAFSLSVAQQHKFLLLCYGQRLMVLCTFRDVLRRFLVGKDWTNQTSRVRNDAATIYTKLCIRNIYIVIHVVSCIVVKVFGIWHIYHSCIWSLFWEGLALPFKKKNAFVIIWLYLNWVPYRKK